MKQRFWLLPILLIFLIGAACASFTVTWNEPVAGTTYSNSPANRKTIDLNFTVIDSNVLVEDINIELYYYPTGSGTHTSIVALSDWNASATSNADMNCVKSLILQADSNWASPGRDCTYVWTMPLNSAMPDGDYRVDVNVVNVETNAAGGNIYDENAIRSLTILTRLSNVDAFRNLMLNVNLILVAIVLLSLLGIGIFMKPDLKMLVTMALVLGISAGVGSMIIGIVLSQM